MLLWSKLKLKTQESGETDNPPLSVQYGLMIRYWLNSEALFLFNKQNNETKANFQCARLAARCQDSSIIVIINAKTHRLAQQFELRT